MAKHIVLYSNVEAKLQRRYGAELLHEVEGMFNV